MYTIIPVFFAALAMAAPAAIETQDRHNFYKQYNVKACSGSNCVTIRSGNGGGCHNIPPSTNINFDSHLFGCVLYSGKDCPAAAFEPGTIGNVKGDVDVPSNPQSKKNGVTTVQSFYCGDSFN